MWNYEKRLQYPVNIARPNAQLAKVIISQFGGPDGEVGAAMRYLSQRYSNTNRKVAGVLTDIGVSVLKMPQKIVLPKNTSTQLDSIRSFYFLTIISSYNKITFRRNGFFTVRAKITLCSQAGCPFLFLYSQYHTNTIFHFYHDELVILHKTYYISPHLHFRQIQEGQI